MKRVFILICFIFMGYFSFNHPFCLKNDLLIEDFTLQSSFTQECLSINQTLPSQISGYSFANLDTTDSNYKSANMIHFDLNNKQTGFEKFELDVEDDSILTSKAHLPSDMEDAVSPFDIVYGDDRTQVSNTKSWPYRATCFIRSTFYNIYDWDHKNYIDRRIFGTGFMEGPNLLVTAGHCVYSDVTDVGGYDDGKNNPRFPDLIEIFAGVNDRTEIEPNYIYYAKVNVINIQKEYYEETLRDFDWAALELDRNLGEQTGYYGKIANWYTQDADLFSYGYPGDKALGTMWETHGKMINSTTYKYQYDLDTWHGQSGSPVFMTYHGATYVCGIHTNASSSTSNQGTRINDFIFKYLERYIPNKKVGSMSPSEYGFSDAYPSDYNTKTNYVTHTTQEGFSFQTRRYRTGYIHNEYIVMSCIRGTVTEAYIEYKFDTPVSKIEVEMSHWRGGGKEWLSSDNGLAEVQYWFIAHWEKKVDLLSSSVGLPTDRENPICYCIEFEIPVDRIRFYENVISPYLNDSNRGRICIGNIHFYTKENVI